MKKLYLFSLLLLLSIACSASPLPAAEVFQLTAKRLDPNTFMLDWQIKPGYFLYQKRFKLIDKTDDNTHLGMIRFPEPLSKTDRQGKTYAVYRNQLLLPIPILGTEPGELLIDVHFQGCSDEGFCYPPQMEQIKLTIDDHLALSNVVIENALESPQNTPQSTSPPDQLDHLFSSNNWTLIIVSFFGFGLLLAFTPCVLPMVPVLSGIIIGHGNHISTRKAFFLSLSYVLSMSITYGAVGAIIALLGNNVQIAMQSPWAISLFSLIFFILALSMFGLYELRLPLSWQSKLASMTRSQTGGHYLSAAFMGCMSTLILSPCVTAPLIGALSYIARSGNIVLGVLALFFLGLGMGTPLLLIGTSAGKLLPKAGLWMNAVKSIFGVMFIAVAIYLMARILPSPLTMALWASLLIFSGIYMGALRKANSNAEKFHQGSGIILLVYGLLVLVGASQGNSNPLQPLVSFNKTQNLTQPSKTIVVKTIADVQKILALANTQGKPVMLDFYADWCASCKIIAATTLQDSRVKAALNNFVVVEANLTANDADTRALLNYFHVIAPPTFLFFNDKGHEIDALRLVGEISAEDFFDKLKQV